MLLDHQEQQEIHPLYKQKLGIYPTEAGTLFVPTLDMWRVHEASKLSAIAARAELSQATWYVWKKQYKQSMPDVLEWLYGGLRPRGFRPTEAMLAFRKKACMKSAGGIASSALRPDGSHVPAGVIRAWLKQYRQIDWLRAWLIRGQEPPGNVTLASAEQVARCTKGLDYVRHCHRAGLTVGDNYAHWLAEGKIPSLEWLLWLYGAQPPRDAFLVTPGLQRLRHEQTPTAICEAAGMDYSTLQKAKKKPEVMCALEKAKAIAARPGHQSRKDVGQGLGDETLRWIWKYAESATLAACRMRANLSEVKYHELLRDADRCGVKTALLDYLNNGERWQNGKVRLTGLVAPKLFIPSANMLAFRKEAKQAMARQNGCGLDRLPGFARWFEDWALPHGNSGKRITLRGVASSGPRTSPQAAEGVTVRADNGADINNKNRQSLPDNPDIVPLAKKIKAERKTGASQMRIALDFTDGNKELAQSLLRQLRRYKHLLE